MGGPRALALAALAASLALALAVASIESSARADRVEAPRRVQVSVEREGGREDVYVLLPGGTHAPQSLALVVALHGRGEAVRGPERGALGWLDDYALTDAFVALSRGRVRARDARGMASEEQLRALDAALTRHPFRALAVVMPYTPDLMAEDAGSEAIVRYASWITGTMLPAVRSALPELTSDPRRTGIDGVSLGGMLSLDVGLGRPETFGSVGAIQPAIRGRVDAYAARATRQTPCLRLASSRRDPFLGVTRALSSAWRVRRLPHELVEYEGPHGYGFNRGPGSIELLRFHHACFAGLVP